MQGYLIFLDVEPGQHNFVVGKLNQALYTETGKTYYVEMNLDAKKNGLFTTITDEEAAVKTLTPLRHAFRDPLPFNEQPPKFKAMYAGNKVLKK
jgi:hypothetical protein